MASRNAHAYPFYVDFQAGGGKYLTTNHGMFGNSQAGASNLGMGANLGLFYSPLEAHRGFDIQVGLESVFFGAQAGSSYFSNLTPYGVIRVQIMMIYASAGISPFTFQRTGLGPGIDNMGLASNTLAYFVEGGALYAATPKFSMGLTSNFQFFSSSGVLATQPQASLNFVMRFYFNFMGIGMDSAGGPRTLEYDGWRYIGK